MAMAFSLPSELQTWTIDDLARLPDDGYEYEIVDGQLVRMTRVSMAHHAAATKLTSVLEEAFGADWLVYEGMAVNIAPTWRAPDVMVFRRSVYTPAGLDVLPADIALAVEIVSPGSRTNDRITKPAEYAAAGIGAFWRVETVGGLSLTAYVLGEGATTYTELGTWGEGDVAEITVPVDVRIVVSDLTP